MKLEIRSLITKGRVSATAFEFIQQALRNFEGKEILISMEYKRQTRSEKQNRYYFGVGIPLVVELFADHGTVLSTDEAHEFVKRHVWKMTRKIATAEGEVVEILDSSSKMDTQEWENRMEQLRAWLAEHGKIMPLPGETE